MYQKQNNFQTKSNHCPYKNKIINKKLYNDYIVVIITKYYQFKIVRALFKYIIIYVCVSTF